jgi:hypothetical protein
MPEQPDVVDGEFTPAFHRRVAALDEAARKKAWEKPKCPKCQRPMMCDQTEGHFVCLGLIK